MFAKLGYWQLLFYATVLAGCSLHGLTYLRAPVHLTQGRALNSMFAIFPSWHKGALGIASYFSVDLWCKKEIGLRWLWCFVSRLDVLSFNFIVCSWYLVCKHVKFLCYPKVIRQSNTDMTNKFKCINFNYACCSFNRQPRQDMLLLYSCSFSSVALLKT